MKKTIWPTKIWPGDQKKTGEAFAKALWQRKMNNKLI